MKLTITEKTKYKADFKTELDKFANKLEKYVSTGNGEWTVKGFIDIYKNIYTISSDTKIVSKILEIHIFPQILAFAESIGYKIILAEKQNWYPDLTFVNKKNEEVKFALDIKTTFRRNNKTAGFTLGSHGGYFKERDKSKNIQFPYSQYSGHYCLGVIYTRIDFADDISETEIYQVKELQEKGFVAFVGDGINDAPALKQSNVAIAIGTGTDIAIEVGDIVLARGSLMGVVQSIHLSKATFRKIKQNLFWAFAYNIIAIPLAVAGFLHPIIAEIAMALSSVSVVTNANLLRNARI